jgi:histidyl-tRNA synthetase
MAKLAAPSGFRDFLPDQYRKRHELLRRIRETYEAFGFEGMDTPAMENLRVFLGKGGGENESSCSGVEARAELERAAGGRHGVTTWHPLT